MKAAQLELQIAAVRRELARVLDQYRELGLQVSLLSKQRNVAQQNLSRTEQYLEVVQPGLTPLPRNQHPISETGTETSPRIPAKPASAAAKGRRRAISRKPRWRRAVDQIKTHALSGMRLQRELSALQGQLAASREDCRQLEQAAERLRCERDQALARLERAAAGVVSAGDSRRAAEEPATVSAPPVAPVARAVTSSSVEEKLQRVQAEKNDIEIALAERDDQIADLQSEREQLQGEIQQLDARLTGLQQDLAAAQQFNQALTSELDAVRDELHRAGSRDGEQIATLQRRIVEIEGQRAALEAEQQRLVVEAEDLKRQVSAAEQSRAQAQQEAQALRPELNELVSQLKTLQGALQEAEARFAEAEQRRQVLGEQLREEMHHERGKVAAREQQLGELQAHEAQLEGELEALTQRLTEVEQELVSASETHRSLERDMQAVVDEYAASRRRDAQQIEDLEHDLEATAARQAEAEQQREQLAQALETERASSAARDQQLADLLTRDERRGAEIDRLRGQFATASQDVDSITVTLRSAEETLHRVQAAKNDTEIALAERDDQIAALQSEREQLHNEVERLAPRLSALEQDLAIAQHSNQALASELNALRGELDSTRSRDGEQIATLQQRVAAMETELEGAAETRAALERDLRATAARHEEVVKQLSEALDQERTSSAARDRQMSELQAQDQQQRAEIDKLTRQLTAAAQEYETVKGESRSFAQQLESLVGESESAHSRAQQELEALQQRLSDSEPARDAALQRVNELETALAEAAAALADSEKRRGTLAAGLQQQKDRLDERERQLAALEIHQQQLLAEAGDLKRRVSTAEQGRTRAQQETQALKPELDELVAQLKAQQAALENAEARFADSERQRQALSDQLLEERSQVTGREQQLSDMQAREQRLQAELDTLAERLSGVQQELSASSEKNRSLEQDKQALVDEYATTRRRDREHTDALEHRLAELEPQLAAAQQQVEDLRLSMAEAAYRQEVSDRRIEELEAQPEQARAPQPVKPTLEAVQLIPGKALQPVAATTTPPLKRQRRRGWARAAAGVVLVLGVVAGALKLRELIWDDDPPVAQLGKDQEPGVSEPSREAVAARGAGGESPVATPTKQPVGASNGGPHSASQTAQARMADTEMPAGVPAKPPGAASIQPKPTVPYPSALSRKARNQDAETGQTQPPPAGASAEAAADMSRAKAKNAKQAPFLSVLPSQLGVPNRAGVKVEAYLMEGAASAGASERPCEDGAGAQTGCSDIETRFMKDTVVGLPSGVKYKVIRNGSGRSPAAGDTVVVSYRGLLPNGTQFDSTGPGGQSEAFRLSQAIPGLQDVLQYMEEGAKWEVYVPSELAFPKPGPLGAQEVIFVIELVAVLDPQTSPVATEPVSDSGPITALAFSGEESYWQTGGHGEEAVTKGAESETGDDSSSRAGIKVDHETFFEEIARLDGVLSLPSGLQYRVLKDGNGSGRSPQASDTVMLNYRGTLPDGREISRSEEAAPYRLAEVLPAWQEALQHMEEGAQWELYLPASLARRSGTRKRSAHGGQPVIYQVELVSIKQPGETAANP